MTLAAAERLLLSLELFGMRFGLDRVRAVLSELGEPQRRFRSVHVVGTNGKSSTVRMIAAILSRHGLRTGAYLSPHLASFTERVRVDGEDVGGDEFAAAVGRAAAAASAVNATLTGGDHVTQFELLTCAAFECLASAGVEAAVIEAGLGGRFDATNVLDSEVQVLTNVGLDHTRWLGETVPQIAREKLDVVRPGCVLVIGADLDPAARTVAEDVCRRRGARIVEASADPGPGIEIAAAGAFQRRNFAVARAAAAGFLGRIDEDAVRTAAAETLVPGRLERVGENPTTYVDGAHNPDGVAALVGALPQSASGERPVVVFATLADKDAGAMAQALAGHCSALVVTMSSSPRALDAVSLAAICRERGVTDIVEVEPDPASALARGRELAGADGVVVATGSIYLVADLLAPGRTARSSL